MAVLSYEDTLERSVPNLIQRILRRPGSLTPRAKAKLARRQRDDAYRATSTRAISCAKCGATGTEKPMPRVKLAPRRHRFERLSFHVSRLPMNLVKQGDQYVHADRRVCEVVVRRSRFSRLFAAFRPRALAR